MTRVRQSAPKRHYDSALCFACWRLSLPFGSSQINHTEEVQRRQPSVHIAPDRMVIPAIRFEQVRRISAAKQLPPMSLIRFVKPQNTKSGQSDCTCGKNCKLPAHSEELTGARTATMAPRRHLMKVYPRFLTEQEETWWALPSQALLAVSRHQTPAPTMPHFLPAAPHSTRQRLASQSYWHALRALARPKVISAHLDPQSARSKKFWPAHQGVAALSHQAR